MKNKALKGEFMFEKYVLLDIENPNTRGNSICAIAVVLVENDKVVEKKYSLINPEDRFDAINSRITGIDASQVQTAPTLKEYWGEIQGLLKENVIIGHNVTYDLAVLSRALQRYDIEAEPWRYSCTLELSKKYIKADSYKLENLLKSLGYQYEAHNALSDAVACGVLFQYIKAENKLAEDLLHTYIFTEETIEKLDERLVTNLHSLSGIIQGILADDVVNEAEMARLRKWAEDNMLYKRYTLFAKIIDTLTVILEDNIVDEYEKLKLRSLVTKYSTSKIYSETTLGIQVLQGIIDGIACDNDIHEMEIVKLKGWLADHDYLTGIYPYDKLVKTVHDVIADGRLEASEKQDLLENFKEIVDPMSAHSHLSTQFPLENKTFCLTGEFLSAPRNTIAKKLKEKGAIEKSGVSAKLDYLFVGGMGSDAWKFGNIGGKIARALELQEKGARVLIVAEEEMEGVIM